MVDILRYTICTPSLRILSWVVSSPRVRWSLHLELVSHRQASTRQQALISETGRYSRASHPPILRTIWTGADCTGNNLGKSRLPPHVDENDSDFMTPVNLVTPGVREETRELRLISGWMSQDKLVAPCCLSAKHRPTHQTPRHLFAARIRRQEGGQRRKTANVRWSTSPCRARHVVIAKFISCRSPQ